MATNRHKDHDGAVAQGDQSALVSMRVPGGGAGSSPASVTVSISFLFNTGVLSNRRTQRVPNLLRGFRAYSRQHVRVYVHCDRDGRMPKALLRDLGMHTLLQQMRRMSMS